MLTRRPTRTTSTARFLYAQAYWRIDRHWFGRRGAKCFTQAITSRRSPGSGSSPSICPVSRIVDAAGARLTARGVPDALLERRGPRR
jgi:hypothetical protein